MYVNQRRTFHSQYQIHTMFFLIENSLIYVIDSHKGIYKENMIFDWKGHSTKCVCNSKKSCTYRHFIMIHSSPKSAWNHNSYAVGSSQWTTSHPKTEMTQPLIMIPWTGLHWDLKRVPNDRNDIKLHSTFEPPLVAGPPLRSGQLVCPSTNMTKGNQLPILER